VQDCVLPHGGGPTGQEPIILQAGDQVDMSFASLHVDLDVWGADSREFKPERWIGLKQSWNVIPFFGGRRTCPAQQNVLTDISYVLTRLLQNFKDCDNRDDSLEYVEEFVFTKESRNGIKIGLVPA
jgi:cytochrome P450